MFPNAGDEGRKLLDRLEEALEVVATQAATREAALGDQLLQTTERWAAWHSQWQTRANQLENRRQALQASRDRAVGIVEEAEARLEETEKALREWLAVAGGAANRR